MVAPGWQDSSRDDLYTACRAVESDTGIDEDAPNRNEMNDYIVKKVVKRKLVGKEVT